ncbi:MAG: hypothetical protein JWN99_2553, partial [Ilumatobacteraceae bacterium]|nr:hypothetical protein [Ilumatobacteraceae bacterium]
MFWLPRPISIMVRENAPASVYES